jgi:hypothetical protein
MKGSGLLMAGAWVENQAPALDGLRKIADN